MFVLEEVFQDHIKLIGLLVAYTVKGLSKQLEVP